MQGSSCRVEVVSVQTNGQRRFTVVELPVFPIVMESLLMPFRYLPELAKFGWIPFAAILAIDLICYALLREDVSRSVTSSLMTLAHFVLFTPFSVAWTKLAVRGPQAVSKHPQFFYSRTQWFYLLACAALMVALLVLVGLPFVVVRYGQRNFESQITLLGETGMMLGLGLYVIGYVRLAFVFPAIAIGRYAGHRGCLEANGRKYRAPRGNYRAHAPSLLDRPPGVLMVHGLSPARRHRGFPRMHRHAANRARDDRPRLPSPRLQVDSNGPAPGRPRRPINHRRPLAP